MGDRVLGVLDVQSDQVARFDDDLISVLTTFAGQIAVSVENARLFSEMEQSSLAYSYDTADAVNRVINQEYQLTFLLSPAKTETIKAIADAGDKMPRKSTYFYPKPPTGLVAYSLD